MRWFFLLFQIRLVFCTFSVMQFRTFFAKVFVALKKTFFIVPPKLVLPTGTVGNVKLFFPYAKRDAAKVS